MWQPFANCHMYLETRICALSVSVTVAPSWGDIPTTSCHLSCANRRLSKQGTAWPTELCVLCRGIKAFEEAEKKIVEQKREQEVGAKLQRLQDEKVGVSLPRFSARSCGRIPCPF